MFSPPSKLLWVNHLTYSVIATGWKKSRTDQKQRGQAEGTLGLRQGWQALGWADFMEPPTNNNYHTLIKCIIPLYSNNNSNNSSNL